MTGCRRPIITSLLVLLMSAAVGATDYYLARSGDDENPGTEAKPWRTFHHAVTHLAPGDTLYVRAGTYRCADEGGGVRIRVSGEPGKPITIAGYPGEEVYLLGSVPLTGWEPWRPGIYRAKVSLPRPVKGLWVEGRRLIHRTVMVKGVRTHGPKEELEPGQWTQESEYLYARPASEEPIRSAEVSQYTFFGTIGERYIRYQNLRLYYCQGQAIYAEGGRGIEVLDCEVAHVANGHGNAYGIYFWFGGGNRVAGCTIHDVWYWGGAVNSHGVSFCCTGQEEQGGGNVVEDCEIYDTGLGVGSKGGVMNLVVRHNRIHDVRLCGVAIGGGRQQGKRFYPNGRYRIFGNCFYRCRTGIRRSHARSDQPSVAFNNTFVGGGSAVHMASRFELRLFNNIIHRPEEAVVTGYLKPLEFLKSDHNLISLAEGTPYARVWATGNQARRVAMDPPEFSATYGQETESIFAEPGFTTPERFPFALTEDSPARNRALSVSDYTDEPFPHLGAWQGEKSTVPHGGKEQPQ